MKGSSYTFNGDDGTAKASDIEESETNHTQGSKVESWNPDEESWEQFKKRTKQLINRLIGIIGIRFFDSPLVESRD